MTVHRVGLHEAGLCGQPFVSDERVGRVVGHVVAEVAVEAACEGAVGDGLREIDERLDPKALLRICVDDITQVAHLAALPQGPVPAEVPFPDAGGLVALSLQHAAHREPLRFDQRRVVLTRDALLQCAPPGVTARQDPVAGRRAEGGGCVGVGEAHPLAGEPVDVRRLDEGGGVLAARVAVAHVVGQDVDKVGPLLARDRQSRSY
ncbi:MAG: hypothetical protein EBZ67_06800 [Chitinophagia bacterium]|nr:hypothetical protein [Chitinophagia bacterium]